MQKRIVIDLDNTILDYSESFAFAADDLNIIPSSGCTKAQIKEHIFSSGPFDKANRRWVHLQHVVYAEKIERAVISPYFFKAVDLLSSNGYEVYIVSHKSEYSYHDSSVSLRSCALSYLNKSGVFDYIPLERVNFCETKESKVARIQELAPELLIDDLEEIHSLLGADKGRANILFGSSSKSTISIKSWSDLFSLLKVIFKLQDPLLGSLKPFNVKSKNQLLTISCNNSVDALIKLFPNSDLGTERSLREWTHLKCLSSEDVSVPTPIASFRNVVAMERLTPLTISRHEALDTIEDTIVKSSSVISTTLSATDQMTCCASYAKFINDRIGKLEIEAGVKTRLLQCLNRAVKDSAYHCPTDSLRFCLNDSSVHNVLKTEKGFFAIDLENSGLGDPCKLLSNLLFHPAHEEFQSDIKPMVRRLADYFEKCDPGFSMRLTRVLPFVYLEWICIILNPFQKCRSHYNGGELSQLERDIRLSKALGRIDNFHDMINVENS